MAQLKQIRKGDILAIKKNGIKRHFQYVCNDNNNLNGNIIFIFKKIYFDNDNPSVEEIVNDTYELVLHTTVRAGFKYLSWEKIGHAEPKDISDIFFFIWHNDEERKLLFDTCGIPTDCNWNIWTTVREMTYEINLPDGICMPGFVYAPNAIEKILFDRMPLVHQKEKEQMIQHHIPLPPIATYKVATQQFA